MTPSAALVSIHAFRGEGDLSHAASSRASSTFQSTPSGGKATCARPPDRAADGRFNPRLPGGRRPKRRLLARSSLSFQSTPSGGKATVSAVSLIPSVSVSIHAFRGEGDRKRRCRICVVKVSIHAFRGEGDRTIWRGQIERIVSIHAFRGEGDARAATPQSRTGSFNPRLPGGRRPVGRPDESRTNCFNPRLPGGRRPRITTTPETDCPFQSTPSGGKATPLVLRSVYIQAFQSTPSGGKATDIRSP